MKAKIWIVIQLLLDLACLIWFSHSVWEAVVSGRLFGMIFWGVFLIFCLIGIPGDVKKIRQLFSLDKVGME